MVLKLRGVRKINILGDNIMHFQERLETCALNNEACLMGCLPTHQNLELLPLPHKGMSIHAMACLMKCD